MKIAVFILSFGLGGAETRLTKVFSKLANHSDVSVKFHLNKAICLKAQQRKDFKIALDVLSGKDCLNVINDFSESFTFLKHIASLVLSIYKALQSKFDVYHLALGAIYMAPILLLLKRRVVIEVTSPDVLAKIKRISSLLNNKVEFVCVSESLATRLSQAFPKNSVDFYPVPYFEQQDYNVVDKERLIVFCARFIERKNPELFVEAIHILASRRKDFKVAILGSGPLSDKIEILVSSLPKDYVDFFGFCENPRQFLERSIAFVSLIEPDNYPSQSVLEAMNYSNVLVLSDTGHSKCFVGMSNGSLCTLDPLSVSDKLTQVLDDFDCAVSMGENSKKYLEEKFSTNVFLSKLLAMYKKN